MNDSVMHQQKHSKKQQAPNTQADLNKEHLGKEGCNQENLSKINADLLDCLNESPIDETQLSHLVEQRAKLVDILLNSLNSQQRQEFALSETKINQDLIARVSKVHASAKKALSDVASSSRAIKQYQQV